MILYRPVGIEELTLIYRSGLHRFPLRLPEQPFFYPVLTIEYARRIARDWNTRSNSLAGYVTEFVVDDHFVSSFPARQAGGRQHQELWIPGEQLAEFNDHIVGLVHVVDAFFGADFVGLSPGEFSLRGKDARGQLHALWEIYHYSMMDFHGEVTANHEVVFAHYPFWCHLATTGGSNLESGDIRRLLEAIKKAWQGAFPGVPLGTQTPISDPPIAPR